MLYEVTDLSVSYGKTHALEGVSLTLDRGETLGIVGESGAGKSTLVRTLLGFITPTRGTVRFEGDRRKVQPVFQDPASSLDPLQSAGSVLREALEIAGLTADAPARIKALLEAIGFDESFLPRKPHQLSAGQKQRLCIARALAVEPQVLLLDEPVSSLDVSVQAQILTLLEQLRAARGLSYVIVSHDLAVVAQLATRVAVLYGGRLVEDGPSGTVLTAPHHPYTRALLTAAKSRRDALKGEPPSPFDRPTGCVFRSRCPSAFERCTEAPPLTGDKHRSACWLPR
ncbi:MAG: ABC transporter ATP-binding protein [Myxococcaceae bacterium]